MAANNCVFADLSASGYIFRLTCWSLSEMSYSDECRTKKSFSVPTFTCDIGTFDIERKIQRGMEYYPLSSSLDVIEVECSSSLMKSFSFVFHC